LEKNNKDDSITISENLKNKINNDYQISFLYHKNERRSMTSSKQLISFAFAFIRCMTCLFVIAMFVEFTAIAQQKTQLTAKITASANVIGNVELIIIKDLEFDVSSLTPTELIVDPQKDPHSGQIKIVGYPKSMVRVTNDPQSILRHESGLSQLYFTYSLSGSSDNVQQKSKLLSQKNVVMLGDDGLFYLWVGGQLSGLENIMPGNYTMEVKIDVEYSS
jgi:hypothetical protein